MLRRTKSEYIRYLNHDILNIRITRNFTLIRIALSAVDFNRVYTGDHRTAMRPRTCAYFKWDNVASPWRISRVIPLKS